MKGNPDQFTVSVTCVEWELDALVPVIVIVNVPVVAGRLALTVMVDVPLLPSDEGLKLMLTPLP